MRSNEELFGFTIWGAPVDEPFIAARVKPGTLDATVLDQDREWVDGAGCAHLLADLDPQWRRNIVAFLYAKARRLHAVCGICEAVGATASVAEYLMLLASGGPLIADLDPYEWLETTPLVRRLRRLQPDIAEPKRLRAWAEAAHASRAADPKAAVYLPQDPRRRWDE